MDLEGILPGEPPSDEEIAALEPTSEEYEAAVRAKWGYTSSETRTEAERHAAAERMLAKARAKDVPAVPLRNVNAPASFRPDPKPDRHGPKPGKP